MFQTTFGNLFHSLKECSANSRITFHFLPANSKCDKDLLNLIQSIDHASLNNSETVESLKLIVGENRLERIFKRPELELDWNAFNEGRLAVTKDILKRIWIGMADIRLEDIEEKGGTGCSTERIDEIYASLLPSRSFNDIFLGESVNVRYYDVARSSGKNFGGLMERVWTALNHWEQVTPNAKSDHFADLEMMTSRFAEREPPVGSVVRLSTGYYVADSIFAGGGAYVTVWKSISPSRHFLIVCRGTASRRNATEGIMSAVSDYLPEIGFVGVRTIWPQLKEYLADNQIKEVDILGKSLGGGHAQYLTALIYGLTNTSVHTLRTCCSVGIPETVQQIFEQSFNDKPKPFVEVYRNGGDPDDRQMDYIPYVGGVHLYVPGSTRFIYATPKQEEGQKFEVIHATMDSLKHILLLVRSLGRAHSRQNSLKEYSLTESHDIEEVNVGKRLEPLRTEIAKIFNAATLGAFDTETFEQFYLTSTTASKGI